MPWISAGASLLGGLFGDDSAEDAAALQQAATDRQTELQRYIYDNNVRLNQRAIDAGDIGRNKLLQLLGLGGTPGGAVQNPAGSMTEAQWREILAPQYTTPATAAESISSGPESTTYVPGQPATVNENALTQAIRERMSSIPATTVGGVDSTAADYGSLMKNFAGADLASEPGYQFGLNEGYKGLDRRAAAGGGYFSGAALKAAQRFGQDYAGTKFGEAFNRDNTNKTRAYNQLSGLTGGAQTAANQVQTAGTNYANNVGDAWTSNANAQGAAGIAGNNAWQNAITGAAKSWQDYNTTNNLLKNITPTSGGFWG